MTLDSEGLNFLLQEEGERLKAYLDTKNIPTISVGVTRYPDGTPVKMGDVITREESKLLFKTIVSKFERKVTSYLKTQINQHQFNALVSISYNIGIGAFRGSTLLKDVNKDPQDKKITQDFKAWRFSAGEPILLNRRIREAKLYFKK